MALLSGNDFEINFGRKTSVFQFYLQLIDISKNQKSISISQRNYQFFPSWEGRGVGSLLPTAKLPTPYGWTRCLIIITFKQRRYYFCSLPDKDE
ncbi:MULTISPECIES: hypothetical protein [unclassified Okeania]|nr:MULTISPECIES: hypothetical protein [unclassified Okeania]NET21801.1 hypothetical protein [Okeania sp. SIO1H5]NET96211.1 hypothetical protein [Okeania sp. SIO1H2]